MTAEDPQAKATITAAKLGLIGGVIVAVIAAVAAIVVAVVQQSPQVESSNTDAPVRPVTVTVSHEGALIASDFEVSHDVHGRTEYADGARGQASIFVPKDATSVDRLILTASCYEAVSNGPFPIEDGNHVSVVVRKKSFPELPPLAPPEYPDRATIPPEDRPKPDAIVASTTQNPRRHVLVHSNETGMIGRLVLFSHSRAMAGEDLPWRALPSDPCNPRTPFSGFRESGGWFSLFFKPEGEEAVYLDTFDFYAKERTEVTVRLLGEGFEADVR